MSVEVGRVNMAGIRVAIVGRYIRSVAQRNSPRDVADLDDLVRLSDVVVDKRLEKRADDKRSRRNRHYESQFIRNALVPAQKTPPPR